MAKIKTLKELDETIYPITKGEAVILDNGKTVEQEVGQPYLSLRNVGSYLYEVTFNELPAYVESDNFDAAGCSSFVRNGKLYRNLDWNYDESLSFITKFDEGDYQVTGMAFSSQVTRSNLDKDIIGQLPYHLCDGVNNYGIMVSTHILYNDWGWEKAGEYGGVPISMVPYRILTSLRGMSEDEWTDLYGDIFPYMKADQSIVEAGYALQFVVTDGVTTKIISPPSANNQPYEISTATSNPKLTNFKWISDPIAERTTLQTRPTGVERWNEITTSTKLSDLRFTKAYEAPTRLSEFIGIDGTTKDSSDAQLTTIYNSAKALYDRHVRDGQTWHTMHSVVYSKKGMEELYTQEDWDRNYVAAGGGGAEAKELPFIMLTKTSGDTLLNRNDTLSNYIPLGTVSYNTGFEVDSTNSKIIIPKGVSRVAISAAVRFETTSAITDHNTWVHIIKNGTETVMSCIRSSYAKPGAGGRWTEQLSEMTIPVEEGDTFHLYSFDYNATATYVKAGSGNITRLCVRAVPTTENLVDANESSKMGILDMVYPVGSIYMSVNNASPATFLGGTWEKIEDKFLLSSGTALAGSTGGSATHTHSYGVAAPVYYGAVVGADAEALGTVNYNADNTWSTKYRTTYRGYSGTKTTNNNLSTSTKQTTPSENISVSNTSYSSSLPPYLAVNMWQRTA